MAHRDNETANKALFGEGLVGTLKPPSRGPLNDRHGVPPFSVLNAREGNWQDRKRRWLALGIESEVGREDWMTYKVPEKMSDGQTGKRTASQTSVFDPVLCELSYHWWCRPGGRILDPFAGGSVRGIVASVLGYRYLGIELRREQVDANRAQVSEKTTGEFHPKWVCGDSERVLQDDADKVGMVDFVYSCPPYGDLEIYSDDPADISRLPYDQFLDPYYKIITLACDRLRDNRFAAFVVGNFRNRDTNHFNDFVGDTVRAFQEAGLGYYNDVVLTTSIGTAAMRSNTNFKRGARKVVKIHQNLLVFVKGDPKQAAAEIPE